VSGKWQVASGKWQVASGKWQVASGKWTMVDGEGPRSGFVLFRPLKKDSGS
jgi:hypothetical protein